MERLSITLEIGNAAVETRYDAVIALYDVGIVSYVGPTDSGIIRDGNGNKIGEWKWEPTEETETQEVLNETFNRT